MFIVRTGALIGIAAIALAAMLSGCGGGTQAAPKYAAQWKEYAGAGPINRPEGLAVDQQGNLLVVDTWNNRVIRADSSGKLLASFGAVGAKDGQFTCPRSAATDKSGNLYVVDNWNNRIEKFSPDGKFLMKFGKQGSPKGYDEKPGQFLYPYGIAVNSKGFIYVSDLNQNRIHKFDPNGKFVMMWGTEGRQDGQFSKPAGLAIDSTDRLYVADLGNDRIQAFRSDAGGKKMNFDGKWGETGPDPEQFDRPYGVAVDGNGDVYVVELGNHRLQKFTASGRLLYLAGKWGDGDTDLNCPIAVAVAPDKAIYISDLGNNRILKWTPAS
jgi:DNA-binding beta-propeller fold protein YncE